MTEPSQTTLAEMTSEVVAAYAAKRSELAKSLGLGRRGAQDAVEAKAEVDEAGPEIKAQLEPKKAVRGRKKVAE